jgi:hypothetical protein
MSMLRVSRLMVKGGVVKSFWVVSFFLFGCATSPRPIDVRGLKAEPSGAISESHEAILVVDFEGIDGDCRINFSKEERGLGSLLIPAADGIVAFVVKPGIYLLKKMECPDKAAEAVLPNSGFEAKAGQLNFVGTLRSVSSDENSIEARLHRLQEFILKLNQELRTHLISAWTGVMISEEIVANTPARYEGWSGSFTSGKELTDTKLIQAIDNCRQEERRRNFIRLGVLRVSAHYSADYSEDMPFVHFMDGGHTYSGQFTECLEAALKQHHPEVPDSEVLSLEL